MGRTISDAVYRMVKNDMPMDAATRGRSRSVARAGKPVGTRKKA